MQEGVEVGYILLKKETKKCENFWEAKLLRHEITGDFKILRRWRISDRFVNNNEKTYHETDWEINGEEKFRWKIIQKIKFSKYKIQKYIPYENNPTLEVLQKLSS